jgi:hypothetical protein
MRPNKPTLQQSLSQTFEASIWKVKVHKSGTVAIETRSSDTKQVAFSAANFRTGEVYFREKTYEEPWKLNLAYAGPQSLLISGYERSEIPENKGILSVESRTGQPIWQKFNISLRDVCDIGIQVYNPRLQPRKYFWIDHLSGDLQENPPVSFAMDEDLMFPEISSSNQAPSFIEIADMVGDVHTLSSLNVQFLSFHELRDNYLQQRLVVYQGDKILLDDIIASGIQKLQPEAFFIHQNHLFYIRNRREIVTYLV